MCVRPQNKPARTAQHKATQDAGHRNPTGRTSVVDKHSTGSDVKSRAVRPYPCIGRTRRAARAVLCCAVLCRAAALSSPVVLQVDRSRSRVRWKSLHHKPDSFIPRCRRAGRKKKSGQNSSTCHVHWTYSAPRYPGRA